MASILILCTGNSCRSQMAEAFLRSFDNGLEVCSAGTDVAASVHPKAVVVMKELGIDISGYRPKPVRRYLKSDFDYVVTVCKGAREACPVFTGCVKHKSIHAGFDDPGAATGTEEEIVALFRRIRDEIREEFLRIYNDCIKEQTEQL